MIRVFLCLIWEKFPYYIHSKKFRKKRGVIVQITLKAARTNANLSQRSLAELLHVSDSTLSRWELGLNIIPDNKLDELCNFCHISKRDLILPIRKEKEET